MKRLLIAVSLASSVAMLSACSNTATLTMQSDSIAYLPHQGFVTAHGTVSRIFSSDDFILRDETGAVEVYADHTPLVVSQGEVLTVKGEIEQNALMRALGKRRTLLAKEIILPSGQTINAG